MAQVQKNLNVSSNRRSNKEVPTLVKVIAVLEYIGAGLGVLFAILLIAGAGFISSFLTTIPGASILGTGFFIVMAIILLAFSVLGFFIGRGLWKAKNWARMLVVIFSAIGVLMALVGIIGGAIGSNLFGLILNGLIGYYLLFSKEVKEAFA